MKVPSLIGIPTEAHAGHRGRSVPRNKYLTNQDDSGTLASSFPNKIFVIHSRWLRPMETLILLILLASHPLSSPTCCRAEDARTRIRRGPLASSSMGASESTDTIFSREELLSSEVKVLLEHGYHNTTESLSAAINRLIQSYPNEAESFIVGTSVGKNPILGLKITTKRTFNHLLRPSFVLLGGIHGDHTIGHELALYIGAFLLERYNGQQDVKVRDLLDSVDIYLIPTLNPDGFQRAKEGDCYSAKIRSGRNNLANVDLDTDFKFHNYNDISAVLASNKLQPETKNLLDWLVIEGKRVAMFATLRTGLTGVTYPFDELPDQMTEHTYMSSGSSASSNAATDKPLFEFIGNRVYYKYQPNPIYSNCTPTASNITVVDGAQLGSTYGTLNDFLYRFTNAFPINVYLSCCKYPDRSRLEENWLLHANSLFALIGSVNLGVTGKVIDRSSKKPVSRARIIVDGLDKKVTTFDNGGFWRMLEPGRKFNIHAEADGYKSSSPIEVSSSDLDHKTGLALPVVINITLEPIGPDSIKTTSAQSDPNSDIPTDKKDKQIDKIVISPTPKPAALFENVDKQIARLDFRTPTDLQKHHNYSDMTKVLKTLASQYPKISRLYSIGTSVEGRELWVLEISDEPGHHQILKPEFRYIANMHGNEVVGRELVLHLAKLFLENYGYNELVTALINSTRIHLLPSMNPDGYENSKEGDCDSELGRPNAENYDLNRNFPDRFGQNLDNYYLQPEVEAVMNWSLKFPFALGANLHGGSLVANYPFDGNKKKLSGKYEAAPDDRLFVNLAKTYATNHPTMSKGEHCYDICGSDRANLLNERFKDGITNGAQWYVLYGGIQDWVYLNTNCMSITVELGCTKFPLAKDLPRYWSDNKKPLIMYILETHRGIYGIVTDRGRPLANATIHVRGIDHDVHSVETGDYWRILLPGEYFVSVSKEGFRTAHRTVTVGKYGSPAHRVDFSLNSGPKDLSANVVEALDSYPSSDPHEHATEQDNLEIADSRSENDGSLQTETRQQTSRGRYNSSLIVDGSKLSPKYQDTKYLLALCFIIVLPGIVLLIYMFGLSDSKRYPHRFGFSRLATTTGDELDGDDDDDEGTRFMKRPTKSVKFTSLQEVQASDSEDELYSVDSWNK